MFVNSDIAMIHASILPDDLRVKYLKNFKKNFERYLIATFQLLGNVLYY